jgi:hypothetical protein
VHAVLHRAVVPSSGACDDFWRHPAGEWFSRTVTRARYSANPQLGGIFLPSSRRSGVAASLWGGRPRIGGCGTLPLRGFTHTGVWRTMPLWR